VNRVFFTVFRFSPPLGPILIRHSPVHRAPLQLSKVQSNNPRIHLLTDLPIRLFLPGFHTNITYVFLFYLMLATCLAHHILVDLIVVIVLGNEYKL
jgi:hypothetical protein